MNVFARSEVRVAPIHCVALATAIAAATPGHAQSTVLNSASTERRETRAESGRPASPVRQRQVNGRRVFVNYTFRQVWNRGGLQEDTLLLSPWAMALGATSVYVFDRARNQVAAFGLLDGELQWRYGREGHGPGEFTNNVDVSVSPVGEVIALDYNHHRL